MKALEITNAKMILKQEQLDELGAILKEEMGVVLSGTDLSLLGNNVVRYFEILAEVERKTYEKENTKSPSPKT